MAEYFEREAAISLVQPDEPEDEKASVTIATAKKLVRYILNHTPDADVAPVVHGKWILRGKWLRCSQCDEKALLKETGGTGGFHEYEQVRSDYCPMCGARMNLEE